MSHSSPKLAKMRLVDLKSLEKVALNNFVIIGVQLLRSSSLTPSVLARGQPPIATSSTVSFFQGIILQLTKELQILDLQRPKSILFH